MRPQVSHFTGTDLIVSYIERHICPTIASDQILGGEPFRFPKDKRPHLAIVMAEAEYDTNQTLPKFAATELGHDFRVSLVFADDKDRNNIPGLDVLQDADVALISVRRRTLAPESLTIVREFVKAGRPVLGIRTASHAFVLRNGDAPDGRAAWPEFDAQVFGGNYSNHFGNKLASTVQVRNDTVDHPIVAGITTKPFPQSGSLYKTSPVARTATVLLDGKVDGQPPEPVAWTFVREDGGRSFYTSLGSVGDFQNEHFVRLLRNALKWSVKD